MKTRVKPRVGADIKRHVGFPAEETAAKEGAEGESNMEKTMEKELEGKEGVYRVEKLL